MQDLDLEKLRGEWQQITSHRAPAAPKMEGNWWETQVANLKEVGPSIGAMWRLDRSACTIALRRQYSIDLDAIRRFGEWCSTTYPL